jgi:predicted ATP-grasp superfamily ATP-dependent carboligase
MAEAVLPAVVVGAGLNGLGVVRSLATTGAPIWLVAQAFDDPTAQTRLARQHRVRSLEDVRLIDDLLRLGENLGPAVLFLTQEASVRLASGARDRLARHFLFYLPPHEVVLALTTKDGFRAAAERLGAPVPRTLNLTDAAGLEQARTLTFPLILKPNERDGAYDSRFRKAYRIASFPELARLHEEIAPHYRALIVQEWIEGDDSQIYFCLQHREPAPGRVVSFCGRKLRSFPPGVGGTASCVAAPPETWEGMIELTDAVFAPTGVAGMAGMEFKRRPDGSFLMIEPTIGRTDFQHEVATWHGYNLVAAAYAGHAGRPPPVMARAGSAYIWFDPDSEAKSIALTGGERSGPGGQDAVKARRWNPYFSFRDPMPWVMRQWQRLRRRLAG